MNAEHSCPDSNSLVALLDSRLAESEQAAVTQHIDACETCRKKLDVLVTEGLPDDLDFANIGRHLRNASQRESSLSSQVVDRLSSVLMDQSLSSAYRIGEVSLDFLEPSDNDDSLGRLGQFEITEVIGRGGMGIALKGRDTRLDRVVAVKVLAPELASNPTARQRFLREARAAAAVSHDHVVTTYAVEPGDLPYLAMEFIDGQSLQQKIDRTGPLEVQEILRIGMQTAWGLAAAHEQGLIHRDIKPSNILLQNGIERVQITDFGLARAVDDVDLTRTGEVAGTPLYMSPEQASGHPVDARSDLFSLGSVLYATCTGRAPFRADSTMAVLNRVCNDMPRPISDINPDIPEWLAGIIDRLLEKDPANRFQSAEEVAELLSQCLAHVQQPAVVPLPEVLPATSRLAPRGSRRPKWHIGAILLGFVFGSLGMTEATGYTQFSSAVISIVRGDGTLRIEVNDPNVSVTIEGPDIVISGAGLHEVRLKPGQYALHAERDGTPLRLERELVTIARRGEEIVRVTLEAEPIVETGNDYTSIPAGAITEAQRLSAPTGFVSSLAFSGHHVLCGRSSYAFDYWNLETAAYHHFEANQSVKAVALSPNGELAAVAQAESMNVWDVAKRELLHEFPAEGGPFRAVSFSPDGEQVVAGDGSGVAIVWDIETGEELHRFQSSSMVKISEFSPDGRQILIGGDDLVLIDTETGLELWRLDVAGFSHVAAFSPDARQIATTFTTDDIAFGSTHSPEIQLREARTGRWISGFRGHTAMIRGLRFLPDGRHLVSGSYDKTLRVWNVASATEVARVETDNHVTHYIAVSPDGRTVASAGGQFRTRFDYELRPHETLGTDPNYVHDGDHDIRVWQLPESVWPEGTGGGYTSIPAGAITEMQRLSSPGGFVSSLAVSGHHLLSGRSGHAFDCWNLDTASYQQFETNRSVKAVALSRNGELAAVAQRDSVQVRSFADGGLIHEFPAVGGPFTRVSLSPDGRYLITVNESGIAIVRDMESGQELHRLQRGSLLNICQFSPSGRQFLIGGDGLALVDVESGRDLWRFDVPGFSHVAAFSPDGEYIATAFNSRSNPHSVQLFEAATGNQTATLSGHTWIVRGLSFLPDGRHLVSGSSDRTLRVWNVLSGREVARVEAENHVTHWLAVSADGRSVATAGGHSLHNPDDELRPHETLRDGYVRDGDYDIRIWQLPESVWPELSPLVFEPPSNSTDSSGSSRLFAHGAAVHSVTVSPDGTLLATAGGQHMVDGEWVQTGDYSISLWDVASSRLLKRLSGHRGIFWPNGLCFSPDGAYLASGSFDRTVRLWDVSTGSEVHRFVHDDYVTAVAVSPDTRTLLSGCTNGTAILWELETGAELHRFDGHQSQVLVVAFSSNGREIVTGAGSHEGEHPALRVWNADTGDLVRVISSDFRYIDSVCFLADTTQVVIGGAAKTGSHAAQLWDVQAGRKVADLADSEGRTIADAEVSSDGSCLLMSDHRQTMQLWNLHNGDLVAEFVHEDQIRGVALSPDRRLAFCASLDGHVHVHRLPESVWTESSVKDETDEGDESAPVAVESETSDDTSDIRSP